MLSDINSKENVLTASVLFRIYNDFRLITETEKFNPSLSQKIG